MDHKTALLGHYLDGELQDSQRARIEKHLESCEQCRQELYELSKLSILLKDTAVFPQQKPENQFVAEVGLLMQRKPQPSVAKRAVILGWKSIPVALAGTWVFIQTSLIMSTIIIALSYIAPGYRIFGGIASISASSALSNAVGGIGQPLVTQVLGLIPKVFDLDIQFQWRITIFTLLPIVLAVLYTCWLASWWILQQRSTSQ